MPQFIPVDADEFTQGYLMCAEWLGQALRNAAMRAAREAREAVA